MEVVLYHVVVVVVVPQGSNESVDVGGFYSDDVHAARDLSHVVAHDDDLFDLLGLIVCVLVVVDHVHVFDGF